MLLSGLYVPRKSELRHLSQGSQRTTSDGGTARALDAACAGVAGVKGRVAARVGGAKSIWKGNNRGI